MINSIKFTALAMLLMAQSVISSAVEFSITADKTLFTEKQSGRLYVFVIEDLNAEPRTRIDWFAPPAMYAVDVVDWDGATDIKIDKNSLYYPPQLEQLIKRTYRVQALLRINPDAPDAVSGEGNFISNPINLDIDGNSKQSF